MSSLRTPTAVFLALLLAPAAILGWLGWRASEPLVERLRTTASEQAGQAAAAAAGQVPGHLAELARCQAALAAQLAAVAAARLPFERAGHLLGALEATAGGAAVRIVARDGRQLLPAGPAAPRVEHLAEWPAFRRWRDQTTRTGAAVPAKAAAAAAAFVAPVLRSMAFAELATAAPQQALESLVTMPWSVLATAGPRPIEVLRTAPAGLAFLAAGWHDGWLAEIPATEAARTHWWRDAGAGPESLHCQNLRETAEAGAPMARSRSPVDDHGTLELLLAPADLIAGLASSSPTGDCAVTFALGAPPAARSGPLPGVATTTLATEFGPLSITATHRGLASIEANATRQRWLTGLGISLLLGSIGLGTGLVRRALLQERRARTLRDDFIANVSHELKTPLTSVRMYTAMLADPALEPSTRARHGAVAEAEAARLAALVDDLLDFAALERGSRRLEPEPVDLAAAARSVAAVWQVQARSVGMQLDCVAEGEVAALVDPTALQRILTNLLQNGCRHGHPSRNGAPSRLQLIVGPGPMVEVRDNGPGVAREDRQRIFGRFERARTDGEGTGLGLALSRELAIACGGSLTCLDTGQETVFRLSLPPIPSSEELP